MNVDPTAAAEGGFSIESIKELMTNLDGLDPAALLPDISTLLGKIELVCRIAVLAAPLLLLGLGLAYLLLAPKEANYHFGYRTFFGMGSVRAWRFTQRIAGLILGISGLILTIIMLVNSLTFAGMAAMDMVWKAVHCLLWELGITVTGIVLINVIVGITFDTRGDLRRKPRPKAN